jgi:hypothetical protein
LNRSVEIVNGRELYMTGEDLDLERVTNGWQEKMERARNGGYAGLISAPIPHGWKSAIGNSSESTKKK